MILRIRATIDDNLRDFVLVLDTANDRLPTLGTNL